MSLSCHSALSKIRGDADFTFALAGNPNVGKSSIFNQLTGMGVITANYPGKTVEVNIASTDFDGLHIGIVDLPGTYAIGAVSEDQWVARQAVLDGRPDLVLFILDATNLARNLYMLIQFLDLGFPIVSALNVMDRAERQGLRTNVSALSDLLGVPVVPTVATRGEGLQELMSKAVERARHRSDRVSIPRYGQDVDAVIQELSGHMPQDPADLPYGLPARSVALLLLEDDPEFVTLVKGYDWGERALAEAERLAIAIEDRHGEPAPLRLTRERHGLAGSIATAAQFTDRTSVPLVDRIWKYTTSPVAGMVILMLVLASLFAFMFYVGSFLSDLFGKVWAATASPAIQAAITFVFGHGIIAKTLIWGPDAGLQAALAVGIPYVLTFYFLLSLLEDTGYLNSVAFLMDRVMHSLGLHGRAVIPMVAGAGCNVPAIIGTRVLSTMRERVIASTLIVLVPCSARTAVIIGAVSLFAGWQPALAVFGISMVLVGAVGAGLNRVMPGTTTGLVMEMFPFRAPSLSTTAKKTWFRFKEFVFVAAPIVLGGSLLLGFLYETGWIWYLTTPLSPVVEGWLGLPAVAGLTLIFAILRKELALQLLVALAVIKYGGGAHNLLNFMTAKQIFVYALVNTIYIPCAATISVLGKELGWRRAGGIIAFTVVLAVVVGGLANQLLNLF